MFVEAGGSQELEAQTEETTEEATEEVQETTETEPEPQVFSKEYVEALRQENARRRVENRTLREQQTTWQPVEPPIGQPVGPQGQVFDPRVDDMLLDKKLESIKSDPYMEEIFKEVGEDGMTFEQRLLETAMEKGWPIDELDALAFKMEKNKLLGGAKQKGIDEAYKSLKNKGESSGEKTITSGKVVEKGDIDSLDDAIKESLKEHGVTDLSSLK